MRAPEETTFDVRVWSLEVYRGRRSTTYRVLWRVGKQRWKQGYPTKAAAESFRSSLITSVRRGEAFDLGTGRPASLSTRRASDKSWYAFACEYADEKWPATSPNHRKGTAEALARVTVCLLVEVMPADADLALAIRSALMNWAFTNRRGSTDQPADVAAHLEWVERNCLDLNTFTDPRVLRSLLRQLGTKLDGSKAAPRTLAWRRSVLSTALNYAVEMGVLTTNPLAGVRSAPTRVVTAIDRRSVINPDQARRLLEAVQTTPASGDRLLAFFGCLYYAALRPEEAANLRRDHLDLPATGWSWIVLDGAAPEVDAQWSDSGQRRESRELKHRAARETRRVPCHPELTALLLRHLDRYGTDGQGRLFTGIHGDPISGVTYRRLWQRARQATFTPEQVASPLAARPYDLRHAAVSTWLNGGVPPTQVAEWAGHSVAVLLKVYAKCLDGETEASLRKIESSLR